MYESEDKMVSHPEHYMSKTGIKDQRENTDRSY